jgi:hypothetical protein
MFRQFRQNTLSCGLRICRNAEDYSADEQTEQRVYQGKTMIRFAVVCFGVQGRLIPMN